MDGRTFTPPNVLVVCNGEVVKHAVAYKCGSNDDDQRYFIGIAVSSTKSGEVESSFFYDESAQTLLLGDLGETWLCKIVEEEEVTFSARSWTEHEHGILQSCMNRLDVLILFDEDDELFYLTAKGDELVTSRGGDYTEGDFAPKDLEVISRHWYQSLTWDF